VRARLHHIGIAVRDIADAVGEFGLFGFESEGATIHDPVQTALARFLRSGDSATTIELVEPDGEASKLRGAVKRGGGLNHLCYEVADLEEACRVLHESGFVILQEPVPAVAFEGRGIAWLMGRNGVVVELLEEGKTGLSDSEPER
jgi:methylmalonyl-CoA/ethylmalonyl-CoA epimerase